MSLSSGKGNNGGYLPKVVGTPQHMENETLLEGLQNILDDYPDGSQILREMVQNAEDAGATCMKIMYDSRPIDPGDSLNISKYFKIML
ncbi:sacsin-like isoform X4 [Mytilus californianus]|uniref:sacsin-like isoform X4 n=1 Tax=Mytilus californianus TaxID=6549 RepID=UPI0022451877|nr:sacsin-like isoform X4 [Mytilus californianus]